ncbi:MAG: hypothetical protein R3F59_20530 [Myxococcota bacterium]
MLTLALSAAVAAAAPPGFTETKTTDHCTLFLGPALSNGVVPMRAECRFPSADLQKLLAAFSNYDDHDVPFATVKASDVVRTEGDVAYVKQVHAVKGVSDREGVLKMTKTAIPGGARFAWTLDTAAGPPSDGRVAIGFDDGFWELTADPAGGVHAVHQLSYDPGGKVPGFLVRWFQTSGLAAIVGEMETWADSL